MAILKNKTLRFGSYGEDYSAEKLEDVADRYEDVIGNNRVRNSAESVSGSQLMRGQERGFVNNSADLTGSMSGFNGFETGKLQNGTPIIKGENYDHFINDYYNYDNLSELLMQGDTSICTVRPSLIEGIDLSETDINNPSGFWAIHNSSKDFHLETASHIPEVKAALDGGASLDDLIEDPILGKCASNYFDSRNLPRVEKWNDYYVFDGDGRHRIIAARELGYDINVKVMRTRAYNENEALQDNQIDEKRVTERADEALVEENAKKEEQASGLAEDNATVEPVEEQTDNQESNKEIGSKHMRNWNKDPGLGTDDRPRMSNDNSDNKWTQLMEEAPSFSEHMEQMESGESDVDQGNTVAEGESLETYGEDTQGEQMSDLTEGSDEAIAEENANQEEQASDLTSEGMSNNEQVDNSQEEADDLIQKNTSGERTDENEQEEQTSDLTGAESSNESPAEEGGEETQSYGY